MFQSQQIFLPLQTPAITGESPVFRYDAMARNDEGRWILAAGASDRSRCGRLPEGLGDFTVGPGLAAWYLLQRVPNPPLERRGAYIERQCGTDRMLFKPRQHGGQSGGEGLVVALKMGVREIALQICDQLFRSIRKSDGTQSAIGSRHQNVP